MTKDNRGSRLDHLCERSWDPALHAGLSTTIQLSTARDEKQEARLKKEEQAKRQLMCQGNGRIPTYLVVLLSKGGTLRNRTKQAS